MFFLFFAKIRVFLCFFALSIAVVPLLVFYLNLVGVKISALNSFLVVLGVVVVSGVIFLLKGRKSP